MHGVNVEGQLLCLLLLLFLELHFLIRDLVLALLERLDLLLVLVNARLQLGLVLSKLLIRRLVLPRHVSHDGICAFFLAFMGFFQL